MPVVVERAASHAVVAHFQPVVFGGLLDADCRLDGFAAMVKPKRPYIRQFREDEMLCFRVLTDYLHLLEDWKVRYAPKTPEDALDDRFVEACQMLDYIEYLADILTVGGLEERVAVVDELMKEGKIAFLWDYVERKRKEGVSHGEER